MGSEEKSAVVAGVLVVLLLLNVVLRAGILVVVLLVILLLHCNSPPDSSGKNSLTEKHNNIHLYQLFTESDIGVINLEFLKAVFLIEIIGSCV